MSEPETPFQAPRLEPYTIQPALPQTLLEKHGVHPLLFGFISLIIIFILYQLVGSLITLLIFGLDLSKANVSGLRIVTGVGQIVLILLPAFILARLASFTPRQYMRIHTPNPLAIIHAIVGVFSLQQILQVYLFFQDKIPLPDLLRKFQDQFKEMYEQTYAMLVGSHSIPELMFVILIIAIIPAIAEEFFFRGLIQRTFENGLTPATGYVFTGIIFGAYHLNPFTIVPLAVLGIYLGFLATKSNSIWVSSAAHFFNNATACIAVYFNVEDDALLTGDPQTMQARDLLFWTTIMGIVFTVSTYLFLKATEPKEKSPLPEDTNIV